MRMTKRWKMRVAPQADDLVRRAAATLDMTLSDFVAAAAIAEAERVLAARTRFTLDRIEWACFAALLDRPPRHAPGLELLFSNPSVFSRE
jgi:uncharacterized protein (DUF1778 family)